MPKPYVSSWCKTWKITIISSLNTRHVSYDINGMGTSIDTMSHTHVPTHILLVEFVQSDQNVYIVIILQFYYKNVKNSDNFVQIVHLIQ